MFIVLQVTMMERSLSTSFYSMVQLPPHVKHDEVIKALLYLGFKDKPTRQKRQEAYKDAPKACSTLNLSIPITTLCKFVAVVGEMYIVCRMNFMQCSIVQCSAFLCLVCVVWRGNPELAYNDDFASFPVDNMTFPYADWVIVHQFSYFWALGKFQQGGGPLPHPLVRPSLIPLLKQGPGGGGVVPIQDPRNARIMKPS